MCTLFKQTNIYFGKKLAVTNDTYTGPPVPKYNINT